MKKTEVAYARFWMLFSGLFMAVTLLKCGWIFLHFGTCKTYSGKKLKYICITEYVSQCWKQWSYVGNLYGCDLEILLICYSRQQYFNMFTCLQISIWALGTQLQSAWSQSNTRDGTHNRNFMSVLTQWHWRKRFLWLVGVEFNAPLDTI